MFFEVGIVKCGYCGVLSEVKRIFLGKRDRKVLRVSGFSVF